uniref:RING-type domain-containing protein n=1 Tax=Meloidogyne enterolobii TaxID=390850 RepID=A0A6V7V098_MELEN|nr:unnamed protein product [Meloidogyne enterolobii]
MENIFFLNNEKSSLFTQRQPLSFSPLLFLQSPLQSPPPEIMSSSNTCSPTAFCFPRSSPAFTDSSLTTLASDRVTDLANNEGEFSFLESKPSLLDQRSSKGSGKPSKGRRNAGEAIWRRKLANQAFLVRIGGGGPGGGKELSGNKSNSVGGWGGHRRRGRVLSELMAEQFAPSVPYSLNRKSRWMKDGVDWLSDLSGGSDGQKLRFCIAETNYSMTGNESVKALHSFDAESGYLQTKMSKSKRGALLADLKKVVDEEENNLEENEIPKKQINFHLTKPNLLSRVFAGKIFTRRKTFRSCTKSVMEVSTTSSLSNRSCVNNPSKNTKLIVPESEPEEENEFIAQYRPKRETYSLADFIKNNKNSSSSPLIIRRGQQSRRNKCPSSSINSKNSALNCFEDTEDGQYTIVPQMEFVELPDDVELPNVDNNENNENKLLSQLPQPPPPPSSLSTNINNQIINFLRQQINQQQTISNNYLHYFSISTNFLQNFSEKTFPQFHPQWLGDNLLLINLTSLLEIKTKFLQIIINYLFCPSQIFINSLIPLDKCKLQNVFIKENNTTFDQIVKILVEIVRADFAEWELEQQRFQLPNSLENLRAVFHSPRLAITPKPISVLSILALQREEFGRDESQFVWTEDLLPKIENNKMIEGGGEEEEEEEEEAFEFIDINELLNNEQQKEQKQILNSSLPQLCCCCHNKNNPSLAMLPSCGHRICRECLTNNLKQQLIGGSANLHCPFCVNSPLPLDILFWLFSLPIVNTICLLYQAEINQNKNNFIQLSECPNCKTILEIEEENENKFGHLICTKCSLYWCKNCGEEPHWPLNCSQYFDWNKRLRPTENDQLVPNQTKSKGQQITYLPQQITGQFADLCIEARTRRMDIRLNWQLGKHVRRLISGDSQAERRFGILRKTALHILEYGTAWLYLYKQQRPRPVGWSQIKSLLGALNDRIECLDNELLFSGSLTDPEQLILRFAELEQLNEKCLVKFGIVLKEGGGEGGRGK